MSDRWCDDCGGFIMAKSVQCPCRRYIIEPDGYADREEIHAKSMREAVEKWAKKFDEYGDYTIVRGDPETVTVRLGDDEETFSVRGEMVPEYDATEVSA